MRNFLKDVFTERDGVSWDIKRIMWAVACIVFNLLAGWTVIGLHVAFNMVDFGIGLGSILAAGGAAMALNIGGEQPIKKDPPE